MKYSLRILATFLSIALLICALPQSVLAQIGDLLNASESQLTTEASNSTIDSSVYVLGEVIDSRTETSKTFRMSDGSFIAADYGKAIHYADENGAWEDYDNTLAFSEASARDADDMAGYINAGNNVSIKLANNSNSNNLLKLTFGIYKVSMHLVGADKSKALEVYPALEKPTGNDIESASALHKFSSGAIYKDILPDVDLEYIISGSSVKENIIIKDTADSYTYTFELKLNGLIPEVDDKGNILLKDESTNETQLVIPAGYMYDANGASSTAVSYSIAHKNGKKYTLTVTADAEWINADDRAFPVTVDPPIYAQGDYDIAITDAYVRQGKPNIASPSSNDLYTGYDSTDRLTRIYLKADELPAIPQSAVIVNAKLMLYQLMYGAEGAPYNGDANQLTIAAREVLSPWEGLTITWNNQPMLDSLILDYNTISSSTAGAYFQWDITTVARKWYDDSNNNNGIVLYPVTEYDGTGSYARAGFYSTDYVGIYSAAKPTFIVEYRDAKGLENIWTYASHYAGVAGTGYVNGFNGNLVFVHDDMTTEGSIIPVNVSHVYNSFLAGKQFTSNSADINAPITSANEYTVGKGWKLSIQETLLPYQSDNSDKAWYVYNDADGTELYFYQSEDDDSKYISENGYGLTVTVDSRGIATLTDEYDNVKQFNPSGRLVTITDAYGNVKRIVYTTDYRPIVIRHRPANETSYTDQLRFTYNQSGALVQITNQYNTSDFVTFKYSQTYNGSYTSEKAGYLRVIQYSLGGSTRFNYNADGTLKSVVDNNTNYTVSYTYTNKRVASVTESVTSATGQTIGFEYANNRFKARTAGQDDIYGNEDDIVTTVMYDNFGKSVCSYSSNVDGDIVYGASYTAYTDTTLGSKKNNKVTIDAVKGITKENIIRDGNCEIGYWDDSTNASGYACSSSNSKKLYGQSSYKLTSTVGGTGYAVYEQTVPIPSAGTYTLSAYVKTENIATTSGGGAYLTLGGTESERLTGTTNIEIQNGWRRISVTKTFSSAGNHTVRLQLANATGTAYFDCVQLEKADSPSDYNFLQNGGLQSSSGWDGVFTIDSIGEGRGNAGEITGPVTSIRRVTQTVTVNAPLNTTFMLSGWAKANSAAIFSLNESMPDFEEKLNRGFGLMALITYSDGITESHEAFFNPYITDWQYTSLAIVPRRDDDSLTIHSIMVAIVYDYNVNTMHFDDICLTVEPAQTYHYDANGNLTASIDTHGNNSLLEYATNGVDPQKYTTVTGDIYNYEYTDTHDISKVTRTVHTIHDVTQTLTYGYDDYGNVTSTKMTTSESSEKFTSTATYTEFGNYLETVTDSLGGVTTYGYDNVTKLLAFVEDANGNKTAYTYDNRQRTSNVYRDADNDGQLDTNEPSVQYLYAQNRLSEIETATTTYTLTYDSFGNLLTIKAGDNVLATYEYAGNNGKLLKLTYGNGDYEEYTYDNLDRLVKVMYNGNSSGGYELFYDANGRLYKTVDFHTGLTCLYEYDSLDRLIFSQQKDSYGTTVLEVENAYDELGRAKGSTYVIGNTTQTYDIIYENITGLVSSYTTPQNNFRYHYDTFDRLKMKIGDKHAIEYTYVANSQRVASYSISQADASYITYSYTYDAVGNITSIKKNGTTISNYEYDSLGRLVREDDCANSVSWVYTYDNAGNILQKYTFYGMSGVPAFHLLSLHPYNGSEISGSYTYSTSTWGDLLTEYNGITIEYDEIGNPLNWRNATNMQWHQRSLTSMSLSGIAVYYQCNADGIRTQKTVGSSGHFYVLDGSTILKETIYIAGTTAYTLYYYYDESGISGLEYNGTKFTYIKNLQGDVIAIINGNGATVVEYKYDAWGNALSITGSMASTLGAVNPFRYRSYYYDTESGWYYLNSRYYDPQVGRFINADGYITTGQGISSYNMFAYCGNNPIMRQDETGEWWHIIAGGIIGAAVNFVSSVATEWAEKGWSDIDWGKVTADTLMGGATGMLTASGYFGAATIIDASYSGTMSLYDTYKKNTDEDPTNDVSAEEAVLNVGINVGLSFAFSSAGADVSSANHMDELFSNYQSAKKLLENSYGQRSVSVATAAINCYYREVKKTAREDCFSSFAFAGMFELAKFVFEDASDKLLD